MRKRKERSGAGGAAGGAQQEEEEEEEEAEELWSDDDDERADDTADASTVATTLGAARAPDGFEIVEQCPLPDVADRTELTKLVGQKILYANVQDIFFIRPVSGFFGLISGALRTSTCPLGQIDFTRSSRRGDQPAAVYR